MPCGVRSRRLLVRPGPTTRRRFSSSCRTPRPCRRQARSAISVKIACGDRLGHAAGRPPSPARSAASPPRPSRLAPADRLGACRRTATIRWTTVIAVADGEQPQPDRQDVRDAEPGEAGRDQADDQPLAALGDADVGARYRGPRRAPGVRDERAGDQAEQGEADEQQVVLVRPANQSISPEKIAASATRSMRGVEEGAAPARFPVTGPRRRRACRRTRTTVITTVPRRTRRAGRSRARRRRPRACR